MSMNKLNSRLFFGDMKSFWNDRFSEETYIYGEEPNVFFRQVLAAHKPGKILLPGEGEGRNAVWAARQGWDVHALDYSDSGKEKALLLADRLKVSINYEVADLSTIRLEPNTYDFIALIFVHLPAHQREQVHQQLAQSLKPDGIILIEAFHKSQLQYDSGGPKNAAMLYDAALLKQDFYALDILELVETTDRLNEGEWHKGNAAVVRMKAKRQAD
ncbi:MAG: class I SAM-dependent methyltransferase [Bacteroidetes bacterium]|nr:class I SAM-dependent methyltransferase [Bacteroidota bacterium]